MCDKVAPNHYKGPIITELSLMHPASNELEGAAGTSTLKISTANDGNEAGT